MTHSNSCLVIQLPKFQALFSPVRGVGSFACLESLAAPPGFNEWSPLLFLSGTRPFDLSCQSQPPPPPGPGMALWPKLSQSVLS